MELGSSKKKRKEVITMGKRIPRTLRIVPERKIAAKTTGNIIIELFIRKEFFLRLIRPNQRKEKDRKAPTSNPITPRTFRSRSPYSGNSPFSKF